MRKFWKSRRLWKTDSPSSKDETAPLEDLKVPASELGWGSRAPRTTARGEDLKVPASELGWGSRAPKTDR